MKRCCLKIAAAMLLLCSSLHASDERPLFDVPKLDKITVDGKADDWGEQGFRIDMLEPRGRPESTPQDFASTIRIGWDTRGLLLLMVVGDDLYVEHDDRKKCFLRDSVELFVSTLDAKERCQLVLSPGMAPEYPELRHHVFDNRSRALRKNVPLEIQAVRTKQGNAYTLEVLVPLNALGLRPTDGVRVGLQIMINDVDDRGATGKHFWYPDVGTAAFPKRVQHLRLAAKPSLPVQAAIRLRYAGVGQAVATVMTRAEHAGKKVTISANGKEIASGRLSPFHGWARTGRTVPWPSPKGPDNYYTVEIDGIRAGYIAHELMPQVGPSPKASTFGSRIPRTMRLLEESKRGKRHPVRILFYGQSITVGYWWEEVADQLHDQFPEADLLCVNKAIGGYETVVLRRTAEHDVYPFYPDLIVFHAYGFGKNGQGLEPLVREIRRRTTAEILIWSHHVSHFDDEVNLQSEYMKKRDAEVQVRHDLESIAAEKVADKYGCEFVDVRNEWKQYLKTYGIRSFDLLYGGHIHLNPRGNALMSALIGRHFRYDETFTNKWSNTVTELHVSPDAKGRIKVNFVGNRIDVVADHTKEGDKAGTAKVLIDGQPPSHNPRLYAITRPSKTSNMWWPGVRRVSHRKPLLLEEWTAEVTEMNRKARTFHFKVTGSKTGLDGEGNNKELFVSNSQRVVLEARDWDLLHHNSKVKAGFQVTWRVIPQFRDVYEAPRSIDPAQVYCTTLAQGLENREHTLEMIPNGDGPLRIKSVAAHAPPLKE